MKNLWILLGVVLPLSSFAAESLPQGSYTGSVVMSHTGNEHGEDLLALLSVTPESVQFQFCGCTSCAVKTYDYRFEEDGSVSCLFQGYVIGGGTFDGETLNLECLYSDAAGPFLRDTLSIHFTDGGNRLSFSRRSTHKTGYFDAETGDAIRD